MAELFLLRLRLVLFSDRWFATRADVRGDRTAAIASRIAQNDKQPACSGGRNSLQIAAARAIACEWRRWALARCAAKQHATAAAREGRAKDARRTQATGNRSGEDRVGVVSMSERSDAAAVCAEAARFSISAAISVDFETGGALLKIA